MSRREIKLGFNVNHDERLFHALNPFWTIHEDGSRSIELTPGPAPRPSWWQRMWLRLRWLRAFGGTA